MVKQGNRTYFTEELEKNVKMEKKKKLNHPIKSFLNIFLSFEFHTPVFFRGGIESKWEDPSATSGGIFILELSQKKSSKRTDQQLVVRTSHGSCW